MGQHILVADDDEHILFQVTQVLRQKGYSVETARDGKDALDRALAHPPDLLITDVMMPRLDGWSLVRELRMQPKHPDLPVIFLTALTTEDEKTKAFRLGADDYVIKPFRLDDFVTRVGRALEAKKPSGVPASKPAAPPPAQSSGLRGDLAQVGLSTLLVLVEMERKTGVLSLTNTAGQAAEIVIRDGKILRADMQKGGTLQDAECIYQVLRWKTGDFDFAAKTIDAPDRIKASTTHLLMEGARLIDEDSAPVKLPKATPAPAPAVDDDDALDEWEQPHNSLVIARKVADAVKRTARSTLPPIHDRKAEGAALGSTSLPAIPKPPSAIAAAIAAAAPAEPVLAKPEPPAAEPEPAAAKPEPAAAKPEPAPTPPAAKPAAAKPAAAKAEAPRAALAEEPRYSEPPLRKRRGPSAVWIVLALVIAGAGVAVPYVVPPPAAASGPDVGPMLQADANQLAAIIDSATKSAAMRAKTLATTPILRAGIETDAATIRDLATSESLFQPVNGETLEIFQLHDGAQVSMLRVPAGAGELHAAAQEGTQLVSDGHALSIIASAPIQKQSSGVGGVLAVSTPCDLSASAHALAGHVASASISGLDKPVVLVADTGAKGRAVTVPLGATKLQLSATVADAPGVAAAAGWIGPARYALWALGGLLLLVFVIRKASR